MTFTAIHRAWSLTGARAALAAGVVSLGLATSAHAGIVSTTGEVLIVAPPPSVAWEALESNTHAFVFQEASNLVLPGSLTVDVLPFQNNASGVYGSGAIGVQNTWKGDLAPGTYDSFYLHADKQGANKLFVGSLTFDADIVGIAFRQNLNGTAAIFGAPGTTYPGGSTKNYELARADSFFTISMIFGPSSSAPMFPTIWTN